MCLANEDTGPEKMNRLMKLIVDEKLWNRQQPKLVISVLGGLKNTSASDLERIQSSLGNELRDLAMASANGMFSPAYSLSRRISSAY